MSEIRVRGSVRVMEIARRVDADPVTVRRDLVKLEQQGYVTRVHGGAVAPTRQGEGRQYHRPLTIGMIVPTTNYYFPPVIQGATRAAAAAGARIVLAISNYDEREEVSLVRRMLASSIDGLLFTSARAECDEELLAQLSAASIPVCFVERAVPSLWSDSRLEAVRTDHAAGAAAAVRHLANLGHRRLFVAVRSDSATTPWLTQGVHDAVRASPVQLVSAPVLLNGHTGPARAAELLDLVFSGSADSIIVHSDQDGIAIQQAAEARGIELPEALSMIAYDDEVAALAPVPLTAVAPPKFDVGATGIAVLMRRLESTNRLVGPALQRITLQPTLNARLSVEVWSEPMGR
ncbi:DNA-binding LacI/PurR family transcriptional regulator [Microbacterium natoriense]|uniref:DNA-binding LacI/PurR family transcriptional regulator n=2 Tax=Microbacterium natoriense TaxID=284570 RepID=A0AAW8EUG6_9MICO|nr:DNA-binding LacI/PurR family transcriptional regulator [Microbacterium natoriense]